MVLEAAYEGSLHGNTVQHIVFEAHENTVQHGALVTTTEHCPYCGSSVQQGDTTCANCGASIESMWANLPDGFILIDDAQRRLEIKRVLGRGGFGITYLVKPVKKGGRRVTVKELFPDGLVVRDASGTVRAKTGQETAFESNKARFLGEAQILRKLKHPSSTAFKGIWPMNGTLYMTLEFIDGETLEAHIARGAHLTEPEAIAILHPVLEALEELHGYGLLHRDIKPANLMLPTDPDRPVELIDFGSAVAFQMGAPTKLTSAILTPQYAPLELYGSNVRLGPPSDLYSLGATIYEAVCGVRVPTALERANGAVVQPLEATVSTVSREFSKLVARTLELRVADRFQTALEMRAALERLPLFSRTQSAPAAQVGVPFVPATVNAPTPQNPAKARQPVIGAFNTPVSSTPDLETWFLLWALILAGVGIPVGIITGWWALFAPIILVLLVLVGNVFLFPGVVLLALVGRYKVPAVASLPQLGVYGLVSLGLAMLLSFIPTAIASGGLGLYSGLTLIALTLISSQALRFAAYLPFRGVSVPRPALVGFGLTALMVIFGPGLADVPKHMILSLNTRMTNPAGLDPSSVTGWIVPVRAWDGTGEVIGAAAVLRQRDGNLPTDRIQIGNPDESVPDTLTGPDTIHLLFGSFKDASRESLSFEARGGSTSFGLPNVFPVAQAKQTLGRVQKMQASLSKDALAVKFFWKPVPGAKAYRAEIVGSKSITPQVVTEPRWAVAATSLQDPASLRVIALGFDTNDLEAGNTAALERGASAFTGIPISADQLRKLKPGDAYNLSAGVMPESFVAPISKNQAVPTTSTTVATSSSNSSNANTTPAQRVQVTGWVVPQRAWNNQFSSMAVFRALNESGSRIGGDPLVDVQIKDLRGKPMNGFGRRSVDFNQAGWWDSLETDDWTGELLAFTGKVADQPVQGTLTARGSKDGALEIAKAVTVSLSADRSNVIVSWEAVPNAKRYEVAAACCGILENTQPNVEFPLEKLGSYRLWLTIRAFGFDNDDILHSNEAAISRGSSFISTKKFTLKDLKRLKPGASINITQWTK